MALAMTLLQMVSKIIKRESKAYDYLKLLMTGRWEMGMWKREVVGTYLCGFWWHSGNTAAMIYLPSCVRLKSSPFFMELRGLISAEILQRRKMMAAFPPAEKGSQTLITDLAVLTSVPVSYSCVLCWQSQTIIWAGKLKQHAWGVWFCS